MYALIFHDGDKLFPAVMPQSPSILPQLMLVVRLCCAPAAANTGGNILAAAWVNIVGRALGGP